MSTLLERLWSKIDRRGPTDCWLWQAGVSRSGRREVDYGIVRQGRPSPRIWRAHRLVLILKTAPVDCPCDEGELWLEWLHRANRLYDEWEACHLCDRSMCCNPAHLEWGSHAMNLMNQRARDAARVGVVAGGASACA